MAKKKVTLENVMSELKTIKKLILKDLQIDIDDMNLDKKDIKLDQKGIKLGKRPFKESRKIFDDVVEWKVHIWDGCPNKKIVSKKKEFEYNCKLLKSTCEFEHCPLNIKKQ